MDESNPIEDEREQLLQDSASMAPIPELYFATVRAIGTPVGPVYRFLEESLANARYFLGTVRLSDALDQSRYTGALFPKPPDKELIHDRHRRLGNAAIQLRQSTGRRDAVARAAIQTLRDHERRVIKEKARALSTQRGVGILFRNLMHHEEVSRLRKLYDRQFFLISIYSDREGRIDNLSTRIRTTDKLDGDLSDTLALELVEREEEFFRRSQDYDPEVASYRKIVTNIPKTFQYGDLFLDNSDPDLQTQVDRFVQLIFGHPFQTPTRDEIGMSDAFGAALQSGNLARQVGAAICTEEGDLLATGTNDVAKPGGSVYRSGDGPADDYRDYNTTPRLQRFARGWDSSDRIRREIFTDLIRRLLADPTWLSTLAASSDGNYQSALPLAQELLGFPPSDVEPVIDKLLESDLVWGAQLFDSLEYGRSLHAEMDAITSAARKGVSIAGATLYCTTLPCHECARLIIGSGIVRVIYIEPYEKSRVQDMYRSEVRFTSLRDSRVSLEHGQRRLVDFVPYVGVSPRRFNELFAKGDRKLEDQKDQPRLLSGLRAEWDPATAKVREAIISNGALKSPRRLADVLNHEDQLIQELTQDKSIP